MGEIARVDAVRELRKQRGLVVLERDSEREEFKRLSQALGIEHNIARGNCHYPLRLGRSYYNSLNQLVVEVFHDENKVESDSDEVEPGEESNFEPGRQVMFFSVTGLDDVKYLAITATVSMVGDRRLVIAVPDPEAVTRLNAVVRLGVQLSIDERTYQLMIEALDRVIGAKGNRLAELRELFYNPSRLSAYSFPPLSFPWLNTSQQQAVNEVLRAKDVAVVHGPPGTGKTTTLVEAIYETLRRENQVLVCAQSNMAVDWISERLLERGVEVLRVGNPCRVNDRLLPHTYERRFEDHPEYPKLWAMRKAIRQLKSSRKKGESIHQQISRLTSRATELELGIHNEIMNHARVVAATLAGTASRVLEGTHFATLFIDEAAQALEAACWIAIRRASRVILAGDHCQLPPTVKNLDALKGGLGVTLMERIARSNPQAVTMLRMQYRMNDEIMAFPNEWFYHGKMESAPEVRWRGILDLDTPIEWVETGDLEGGEQVAASGVGRFNREEAELTVATLHGYVERIGRQRFIEERIDVGLISPYRAQVRYLRRLLSRDPLLKPLRSAISVNTVDGFQGQERDVIVISLVRSNDTGDIGFLRDLRRMNVAMTRARMKLIILGDSTTLSRNPFYRKLHKRIKS